MSRLFIRIYLGSILAVFLATVGTGLIVARSLMNTVEKHIRSIAVVPASVARDRLLTLPSQKARENALKEMSKQFGYPVRTEAIVEAGLSEENLMRVKKGETIVAFKGLGPSVYAGIPGEKTLLRVGPLPTVRPAAEQRGIIALVLVVVLMGGVMFVLVRPLERRLRGLANAADQFGQNDLETRAAIEGEDAIAHLGRTFNQMADRMKLLVGGQQELLNAVAHELRTPLARLRFAVEEVAITDDSNDREKQIEGINADLEELSGLVSELLTYGRLQHGAPKLDEAKVNVPQMFEEIVNTVKDLRPEIEMSVSVEEKADLTVLADRKHLKRAALNFATNALRYATTKVVLRCFVKGMKFVIQVDDDGPGVPKEHWDRIFEPFARLETSRNKSTGGYGLGLAITRRVAEWHDGEVSVGQSDLGGARFTLSIKKTNKENPL